MRSGFEYLKPGIGLHSSMADFDETPDHRAQLMRAWSTDKALMAQAGLSMQANNAGNEMHATHLGMFNNGQNLLVPETHVSHKDGKLHKWVKKSNAKVHLELTPTQLKTLVVQQVQAASHEKSDKKSKKKKKNKKHGMHNPHLISDEDTTAIDVKITSGLKEYKKVIDDMLDKTEAYYKMIPTSFSKVRKFSSMAIDSIRIFKSEGDFGKTFAEIGDRLFTYVTSPDSTTMKRYRKAYSYPSKERFTDQAKIRIMKYGFLVHALTEMIYDFTHENSKIFDIPITSTKDLNDHLKNLNTHYKEIINLKEALHKKYIKEGVNGPLAKHRQLRNLSEDIEQEHENTTSFKMGQPFEEY
jgi:hypothetical protein